MSINNFIDVHNLMHFDTPNPFYLVEILKRRKDNPDMERDMEMIDQFCIYDHQDFHNKFRKIQDICIKNNARAYIRVNVRDSEQVALRTLRKLTDYIIGKDYKAAKKAFWSAAGELSSEPIRRWVVDVDSKDAQVSMNVCNYIEYIQGMNTLGRKIIMTIATKNGFHIITEPFDLRFFTDQFPDIDIHKDNGTILYIP